MNVIKLVASSCFLTVNVMIAQEVGLDAAVILGELASTQVYWEEHGEVDENGMFYETAEQIEKKTTLTPYKQAKAIKALEDRGLVKTKMRGVPAKKYFFVDGEELGRLLESKFPKNLKTSIQKTLKQDSKKLEGNNKRENNKRENKKREIRKDKRDIVFNSTLSEPVGEKLIEYLEYRDEMKKPFKSERGIKTLVGQVEKQEQIHGATAVIGVIDKTMSNGWQGLFWDKIENSRPTSKLDMIDQWAANMERKSNEESGIF